jgi:hypothetical protein
MTREKEQRGQTTKSQSGQCPSVWDCFGLSHSLALRALQRDGFGSDGKQDVFRGEV